MWKFRPPSSGRLSPSAERAPVGAVGPLLAGAAALCVSWCVLSYVRFFQAWLDGDVRLYQRWGSLTAFHHLAYRDFPLEYPPGAIPIFAGPIYLRKLFGYHGTYHTWFRVELLFFGLVTVAAMVWALRSLRAGRLQTYGAVVFSGLVWLALGPIAVSRYDAYPAAFAALGVGALLARRERLACGVLAAGAVVKIYPAVLLPLALVALWRRRGRRGLLEGVGASVGVAAVGFVPFLVLAPRGLWRGMWRQVSRPLQVESLAASFFGAAHHLGGLRVHAVHGYGSDNLVTPGAHLAGTLSTVAVALALVAIWVWYARSAGGAEETALAAAASVAAYVALSKVFSPQYLVWLFALVPLVRGRRGLWSTLLLGVAAGLTQAWEPYRYHQLYVEWTVRDTTLLVVRDLVVVALLAALVWPRPRAERSPVAAPALEPAD